MSRSNAKPPQPACCEELDEAQGEPVPDTKVTASANTKVKRSSRESLEGDGAAVVPYRPGSAAGDSGYSSKPPTIASTTSDDRDDHRQRRRASIKVDASCKREEERRASPSRNDRRSSRTRSQAPAERSRSTTRKEPTQDYDPDCLKCNPDKQHHMERPSRRSSREDRDYSRQEPRIHAPTQTAPRAQSRTRPVSADYSRMAPQGVYQAPPSAWKQHHGPQLIPHPPPQQSYTMGPPPAINRVPNVPQYTTTPVFDRRGPTPQPAMRRGSVNYGQPSYQHVSYTPTTTPVLFSPAPIQDTRQPSHRFSVSSYEDAHYRQLQEEAMRPRRPSVSRSSTLPSPSSYPKESLSRSGSKKEPSSPTSKRPPSRTSNSYERPRRDSSSHTPTRRPSVDGHERRRDFEDQLSEAMRYQKQQDTNPRMHHTSESVKTAKLSRSQSNAETHKSRGSKESGRKTATSQGSKGIQLSIDEFKISIPEPRDNSFSVRRSEQGIHLSVRDGERVTKSVLLSKEEDNRSRSERSARKSSKDESSSTHHGRESNRLKKSDRSRR